MKTMKNKMKQNSRGSSIIPSKNNISLTGSSYPLLSRDIRVGRVGVMGTYTQPKEKEDEYFTNCFGIRMKRNK